jgi:flagellar protein FliS
MNSQINAYKKNQINTTSSENLVLMLYDGARKYLKRAIKSLEDGKIQEANSELLRAQDIVSELMSGINFDAGDIAAQLFKIYEYMHYRLVQANIKKDSDSCKEVLDMINDLRTVWAQAVKSRYTQDENINEQNLKIS